VTATQRNIQEEIAAGNLREDLYYRLNVVPLDAPTLRERREDIPLLVDYYLAQAAEVSKMPKRALAEDAVAALQAYNWPGNVQQLRNVMEWLLIMCPGDTTAPITSDKLPKEIFSTSPASLAPGINT